MDGLNGWIKWMDSMDGLNGWIKWIKLMKELKL